MMAITLENLPSSRTVAKATIGSLMVLADMSSLASSHSKQVRCFTFLLLVYEVKVESIQAIEYKIILLIDIIVYVKLQELYGLSNCRSHNCC